MGSTSQGTDSLTVIVFTRDESSEVDSLVSRLGRVLRGSDPEIFTVVERRRARPAEIWSTVMTASRAVRSTDPSAQSERSAAIPAHAREDWVVVMDGDRLHPVELVPALIRAGKHARADLVVASDGRARGFPGASLAAASASRSSSGADRLAAQLVVPHRLTDASDPMRGFFAVRRDAVDAEMLTRRRPGLTARSRDRGPGLSVAQLPAGRRQPEGSPPGPSSTAGTSAVAGRRWQAVVRAVGFGVVGVTGLLVNSLALWAFVDVLGLGLLLSATLATQVSTTWNFVLSDALVFRGRKSRSTWSRFLGFAVVNNIVLLLRLPLLSWLVFTVGITYLWANVLSLLAAFAVRFLISDRYLFSTRSSDDSHAREAASVGRASGRHSSAGVTDLCAVGEPWPPGGARDRPDGGGCAVPA